VEWESVITGQQTRNCSIAVLSPSLSTKVDIPRHHFGVCPAPLVCGRKVMESKEMEYSVVQLAEGSGWRWELRLGEADD
jgi:hypothetical protein